MNNQEYTPDMLLKLNNIMKLMMINRSQLMAYLKDRQSTINFFKVRLKIDGLMNCLDSRLVFGLNYVGYCGDHRSTYFITRLDSV